MATLTKKTTVILTHYNGGTMEVCPRIMKQCARIYGLDNGKVIAIQTLRMFYPELGLREAKEAVECAYDLGELL